MDYEKDQIRNGRFYSQIMSRILFIFFFISCAVLTLKFTQMTVDAASDKIRMNRSSVTLETGKEFTLKLKGVKKGSEIQWAISGEAAGITVKKGNVCKIIGKEAGKATVFAACDGKIYKCKVKVKLPPPALSEKKVEIKHGERTYIVMEYNSKPVKWTVKNSEIIDTRLIGQYCIMVGKRAGTTYVTAQTGGKTYRCKVTVSESGRPSVVMKKIALTAGHTVRLSVRDTGHKVIKWGVENPEIVSISKYGVVKAKKRGTTRVFAVTNEKTVYAKIRVFDEES